MLDYLYRIHIEEVFGKAGTRSVELKDVILFAEELENEGLVHHRCISFLRQHPFLEFITQYQRYYEIIRKNNIRVLEVGSFIGNEIRRFYKDGFCVDIVGIDINPWHLLVGFLLHNDSPYQYDIRVGDACNMAELFKDSKFNYIYSLGLIQSLLNADKVIMHLKETYRIMDEDGIMFGSTFSFHDADVKKTDHEFFLLKPEELRIYLSDAGFKEIKISEARLFRKGISFANIFECKK